MMDVGYVSRQAGTIAKNVGDVLIPSKRRVSTAIMSRSANYRRLQSMKYSDKIVFYACLIFLLLLGFAGGLLTAFGVIFMVWRWIV